MKCPVCGKTEFDEYSSYDICPFCKWEDDGVQSDDHNYAGGANDLSVNEARIEYFLMSFSTTKEKAKELYDEYNEELRSIIDHYGSYNRLEEPEKARQEGLDYAAAREKYIDRLNALLMNILNENR